MKNGWENGTYKYKKTQKKYHTVQLKFPKIDSQACKSFKKRLMAKTETQKGMNSSFSF